MARCFAKVPEEEMVAINEAAFFLIHLIRLILKQLSPLGSVKRGGYPPLFTSPSGNSCMIYNNKIKEIDTMPKQEI